MAGAIDGGRATLIAPNKVEERLADPLDRRQANQAQRSDEARATSGAAERQDGFADYLNQSSITLLEQAQETNRFDPAAAITEGSVYKAPNDKPLI